MTAGAQWICLPSHGHRNCIGGLVVFLAASDETTASLSSFRGHGAVRWSAPASSAVYESVAMLLLALGLSRTSPPRFAEGDRFRVLMFSYFGGLVLVDFLNRRTLWRIDGFGSGAHLRLCFGISLILDACCCAIPL